MPGDAAHESGCRVVHNASQGRLTLRWRFRRSDAISQTGRRLKHRVAHSQRLEKIAAREIRERLSAHAAYDFSQQNEIDVAIDEPRAGRGSRFIDEREADSRCVTGPLRLEAQLPPDS